MRFVLSSMLSLFAVVPLAQAPVALSNEAHHHLQFENQYVRVYDVNVASGDATLMHTHASDYVFVTIGAVALKAQVAGSPEVDLILKDGEVRYSKAPVTHKIGNPSPNPFRNITVEILKAPAGLSDGSPGLEKVPGYVKVLENDRVRVWRLSLDPGQSTPLHTEAFAGLTVAVSGGQLQVISPVQKATKAEFKRGDFQWRPGETTFA